MNIAQLYAMLEDCSFRIWTKTWSR